MRGLCEVLKSGILVFGVLPEYNARFGQLLEAFMAKVSMCGGLHEGSQGFEWLEPVPQ